MKRQGAGRVLTFAVTGALLGGAGVGGCGKYRGPFINPGPGEVSPPQPEEPLHVNPGPDENPGAGDGGAGDGGAADGGAADGGGADGGPPEADVNPGPVDQPKPPVIVNTVKQPEPEPPVTEPSTMNIRKVEDDRPVPKKSPKYVNTVRVAEPEPE